MNSTSIPNAFKEELKQKSDIVSVISRYIPLERKGKTHWGLCPFHGEKTPSFAVNENEQFFHCFGCKESGDVFAFVQKMENCTFVEAAQILADWAGLKVPEVATEKEKQETEKKKKCLLALREAAMYYHECLNGASGALGREYFSSRGVSDQLARVFGLGYSSDFYSIKKHLNAKGYPDEILLEAGILKKNDRGLFDPMGQRVVFPVLNVYGEVVAFTGRSLKPKVDYAKYLNTAETIVYSKRKNLYAINLVKKYQKQGENFDYFIIVEGNMDVISLHKAGFHMAVAGMGTALTENQAKLIKRFVNKVYICYDGDTAGQKATLLGLEILKNQGLDVLVVSLPQGKDPDDVIREGGKAAFKKLLEEALPLVEYRLRSLTKNYNLKSFDGKSKFATAAIGVLKELPSEIERETYLPLVQELSGTSRDFLRRQLQSEKQIEPKPEEKLAELPPADGQNATTKAEKLVLGIIYHKACQEAVNEAQDKIKYFTSMFYNKDLLKSILSGKTSEELIALYPSLCDLVGEIVVLEPPKNAQIAFWDCVKALQRDYLKTQQDLLSQAIDKEIDKDKRQELLKQLQEITKERNLFKL